MKIEGPVFTVMTPFKEKGAIDYACLRKYLHQIYDAGGRIFYVTAYSSRFSVMSRMEIRKLNGYVTNYVHGIIDNQAIVIVSDPIHCSTEVSLNFAKQKHADAISLIYGERYYSNEAIYAHYEYINNRVNIPIVIHLTPLISGITGQLMNWPIVLVDELVKLDNVIAIKEDSKDDDYTEKVIRIVDDRLPIILSGGGKRRWMGYKTKADILRTDLEDFINRAVALEVDGVSLESCFLPSFDSAYLSEIKGMLDEHNLDRVYAWGHPDGLEGGKNEKAYEEMIQHIEFADAIGAKVMRVVGSSLMFRFEPHGPQIEALSRMFSDAVKVAEPHGIKLADENHIDFDADEMLTLINNVNSPNFGINFDTGNFLRVLDDPIQGMEKLAKHVFATHIKDLKPQKSVPVNEWFFFSSTPIGEGLVDNRKLAQILKDNGYEGFLAVEIDFLHPDYNNDEDMAVADSIKELKRIASMLE